MRECEGMRFRLGFLSLIGLIFESLPGLQAIKFKALQHWGYYQGQVMHFC